MTRRSSEKVKTQARGDEETPEGRVRVRGRGDPRGFCYRSRSCSSRVFLLRAARGSGPAMSFHRSAAEEGDKVEDEEIPEGRGRGERR